MERLKIISNNEKKYNLLPQFVQPPLQGRRWRSKANYCLPRHTKFGAWLSGVTAHIHSNLNPRGFQNTQANKLIRLEKTILWSRGNENSKVQSLFVTCILEYLSADFSSSSLKQMKRRLEALFRINVSSAFFVMRPQEARSRGRECGCCWVWVQGGVKGNLLSKTHYCHVGDLGWAGPPRDNRDIPRPRRWDVTRIGTGRRGRAGDTETRQRRASCANTELCTGTASAWRLVTRDGVLAPEECSYQTIPSCSLGSVRGQFWQVAVITLITRLLLIKKLSLKDDTMTLARHSLLPGPLLRCYAWQLFSGYTVWWHSHTSTQLH